MFIMSQFFVIYFIILGYTNTLPINHDGTTILSLERQVEMELSPFTQIVQFLEHPPAQIPPTEFLKLGIQLKSQLKMFAQRLVNAEMEVKMLLINQGGLETQKDKTDMYQLLLALTFRVDTLEKLLAPGEEFKAQQRSKRWIYIFTKNTPAVENLRKKVYAAGMTEASFAEQVERLIQERNSYAGHANIPLPRLIKEKTIEGALEIMEITEDDKAVETLKILVAPVKGLDFTTTQKS